MIKEEILMSHIESLKDCELRQYYYLLHMMLTDVTTVNYFHLFDNEEDEIRSKMKLVYNEIVKRKELTTP